MNKMPKTPEYLAVSNFIKNEEGYQKILKSIVKEVLRESIEQALKEYFQTNEFKNLILSKLKQNVHDSEYNQIKQIAKQVIADYVKEHVLSSLDININVK